MREGLGVVPATVKFCCTLPYWRFLGCSNSIERELERESGYQSTRWFWIESISTMCHRCYSHLSLMDVSHHSSRYLLTTFGKYVPTLSSRYILIYIRSNAQRPDRISCDLFKSKRKVGEERERHIILQHSSPASQPASYILLALCVVYNLTTRHRRNHLLGSIDLRPDQPANN